MRKQTQKNTNNANKTCALEQFDDTKEVIKSCKSKKDRPHNGQKKNV
jgi:hypothetical protein